VYINWCSFLIRLFVCPGLFFTSQMTIVFSLVSYLFTVGQFWEQITLITLILEWSVKPNLELCVKYIYIGCLPHRRYILTLSKIQPVHFGNTQPMLQILSFSTLATIMTLDDGKRANVISLRLFLFWGKLHVFWDVYRVCLLDQFRCLSQRDCTQPLSLFSLQCSMYPRRTSCKHVSYCHQQ